MFDLRELSRFFNQPVHLFRFAMGPLSWHFTTSDVAIVLGDEEYLPCGISRSAIRETVERAKNNITITMPYALDPAAPEKPVTQSFGDIWRPYPPSQRVMVTCMALHRGDTDVQVEWMGNVLQPEFTDTSLKLTCAPTIARHRAKGGGRRVQRACELTVYGQGLGQCNLLKEAFAVPVTVTAVSGLLVTAPGLSASTLSLEGGFVEWTLPSGLVESRTVMAHSGDVIELDYGAFALAPGLELIAYPGCPHTWAACEERGNTDNYGGFIYLTSKNPWSGNPL
ncbi:DUF2163 domain-containing protein [Stenotrophomonas sp. CW117]|uniref:phage BR0599 family protein n=1 Tax=Stenotrophomonas TaxID=40323 RepID=UPI00177FB3D7|nr:phage BR0599 family protein [Stenotrophomonas sp. CW117]QOF99806.1 DUF2163 domain-containing protein [Stenotrophomonas sp. CW117]